jgi:DNA-binding MarR family transcriptional regulator
VQEPSPTEYGNSTAFLLSQIGARSAELFAARLTPLGITPRQFAVLSNLAAAGAMTQQQLSDALGVHRNNMVGLIDEMEAAGWVRRHRGTSDRRVFEIQTTDTGRELIVAVNELIPELDELLTGELVTADRQALTRALAMIARHLGLTQAVHPHVARRRREVG